MKLPTAVEMRALDRSAIEDFGIPGIVLMENAGLGTVHEMIRDLGPCENSFALIFIGPGNNGGDGFVIGRHLHQRGCQPIFFIMVNPDALTGDAAVNFQIVEKLKLPFHIIDSTVRVSTIPVLLKQIESRGLPCFAVVDALFGTGLGRDIDGRFADVIDLINQPGFARSVPVVSVDIPSGLDSDSGRILGKCIRADYTITFGCPKPGHFIHGSSDMSGALRIVDIGIPPEAVKKADIATELITESTCRQWSQPLRRDKASHKGSHGHLLILAGSPGKTGAALLAARGALRSGCGLVSLCVPHLLNAIFETALLEAMTIPLRNSPSFIGIADRDHILEAAINKKAIVLGPGLGTNPATAELVLFLYQQLRQPLIIDADALNILASHPHQVGEPAGPRIFTPHPGELGRLANVTVREIQDNRLAATRKACTLFKRNDHQIIVVLKGAGTIVAVDNGMAMINTTGNPGMATGGMGDVLSGIIGALICQGIEPLQAAAMAVYLHGAAGDELLQQQGVGYSASELADTLPSTIHTHIRQRKSNEECF
ncbi:NAD(P)H-hydrate dehydratase [Desulfoprunum benzoelyticum]|uniref:Bifunctional NAD(P)H-hydrate repair enzyme n=1 Tax=Desulfoprunum benzoelyticum TaxID=1506996 RepID=A0A840UJB3_9BACT|nr:NAD(P)H-hydrate dehydratase [Desulfoprunum benzoelyticum]MBB5346437.1 NAD(P)H-hydrate epimerase [Desulfoprunum benzoelyticum]MBM9528565.1 NAD(P)H-hydrate dehydratase [Desulfoprunum benzoelyticum]